MTKRVFVIQPGATFSTGTYHDGLINGLKQNGVEVIEYRLDVALQLYGAMIEAAIEADKLLAPIDAYMYASTEAIAMAVHYEPDAVLVVSGGNFHPLRAAILKSLGKQRQRPMPVAVLCTESPYETERYEREMAIVYDHVFTNDKYAIPLFTYSHPSKVHYLQHAYDSTVHKLGMVDPAKVCDAFFVGTGFPERKELFDGTLGEDGIRRGGVDWQGINFKRLGYMWTEDAVQDTLAPKDVTDNAIVADWYRSSKVNINQHRTIRDYTAFDHINPTEAYSLGPRAYEIPACGGFMLSDYRPELTDVYNEYAATYRAGDSEDLGKQIRYWLNNDTLREEFALAQHDLVQPHNWSNRAKFILETILA